VVIGLLSPKCSNEGRDYPGLKLEDPSFTTPNFAWRLKEAIADLHFHGA
jgi:uncharacterized protein (DUF736 family)